MPGIEGNICENFSVENLEVLLKVLTFDPLWISTGQNLWSLHRKFNYGTFSMEN